MGKTPKKQDVIERAFEIRQQRNHSISSVNPEVEELSEDGTLIEARDSLMRSEDSEYVGHIEEEARRLGLIDSKVELGRQRKPYDFQVDIEELLRSGIFICGGRGTTKSNLAMAITDILTKRGITAKVFDISQAWRKSSIPLIVELKPKTKIDIRLYESIIFDMSRLLPKDSKDFIAQCISNEWELQVSIPEHKRKPICYIFEEAHMLIPQGRLRSNEAQQILRLMTVGRNYRLSYIAITQRPALCDTSVFELSFQRYFARMDGQNDLKKVANHIGSKARELQNLKLGEFLYDVGTQTKWIATEEFRSNAKPQKSSITQFASSETKKREANPNAEAIALLLSLMAFAFLVGALLV